MDSTSILDKTREQVGGKIKKKMTIGVPRHFLKNGIDEVILSNFEEVIEKLKIAGYEIKEIELPNIKYALSVYYIIMPAEASANLSRYDGVRFGYLKEGENLLEDYLKTKGDGFGKEVRRRIMLGTFILSAGYYDAFYNKAIALREIIKADFNKVFESVDAIITPTTPTLAFKIGEKSNDPLQMYLEDVFTVSANVAGIPAISVPSGFAEKLPLGLQILSPRLREDILFQIGKDFLGE